MNRSSLAAAACSLALVVSSTSAPAQTSAPAMPAVAPETRLYVVEITTGPQWDAARRPAEQAHFREHSANLQRLREAGHILLGGRYSDKGLLVLSAQSADRVRELMDQDPSMAHGTFRYAVHEFNVFYPGTVQRPPKPAPQ